MTFFEQITVNITNAMESCLLPNMLIITVWYIIWDDT